MFKKTILTKIILVSLVAVVSVSSYVSTAMATANVVTGYIDWQNSNTTRNAGPVRSNGWVCVDANFGKYGSTTSRVDYKWHIDVYKGPGQWENVRDSYQYIANGLVKHECYDQNIFNGHTYRVRFDILGSKKVNVKGDYKIRGYQGNGL